MHDAPVIWIIVAVIAILNWLIRRAASSGSADSTNLPPFPRGTENIPPRSHVPSGESEEERMRKFREALGMPVTVETPKKVIRPVPAPRYVAPVRQAPPRVPAVATPAREVEPVSKASPSPWEEPSVAAVEFAAITPQAVPVLQSSTAPPTSTPELTVVDFRALLKSPSSLRTAVVLREVLGPPKALQPSGGTLI